MKIVKARVRRWAQKLKKLKQCKGTLKRGKCFCVLGAACEVFHEETGEGKWKSRGEFRVGEFNPYMATILHPDVLKWYGINVEVEDALLDANDYRNVGFSDLSVALTAFAKEGKLSVLRKFCKLPQKV